MFLLPWLGCPNLGRMTDQAFDSQLCNQLPGKVGSDGWTFTADKNSRIWMVSNPETLGGIDAFESDFASVTELFLSIHLE